MERQLAASGSPLRQRLVVVLLIDAMTIAGAIPRVPFLGASCADQKSPSGHVWRVGGRCAAA